MPEFVLNDADRKFLRESRLVMVMRRHAPGQRKSPTVDQYTRLRRAGLVRGDIDVDKSTRELLFIDVVLTDAGRLAIGLPIHGGDGGDKHV
jgi:hypothetical protein